jgi:nitroreductase
MNELKQAMEQALEALEEIALAGMSGTGMESEEGMRDWHARRAWEFIGIAARALPALRAALSSLPDVQTDEAEFFIEDAGGMFLASTQGQRAEAWSEIQHYAAQYADEGPITIYEITRTKVSAASAPKEPQ